MEDVILSPPSTVRLSSYTCELTPLPTLHNQRILNYIEFRLNSHSDEEDQVNIAIPLLPSKLYMIYF